MRFTIAPPGCIRRTVPLLSVLIHLWTSSMVFGAAEHVVVVVMDGLRPDFVTEQYTPNLYRLAKRGTFFRRHHSTYITSTEVNGTSLATGAYPARSGIIANTQFRPDVHWMSPYGTESLDVIRRGDLLSHGHYLAVSTVAETLQAAGVPTVIAGSKPVVLLHDRAPAKTNDAQKASVTLFRGRTLPRATMATLVAEPAVGPFPKEKETPTSTKKRVLEWLRTGRDYALTWANGNPTTPPLSRQIDAWTTRAVIHGLWKHSVPKYTLVWLSEPDSSQHRTAPGSPNAVVSLATADDNLGLIIQALRQKGILDRTDLLVVSDHGFSTVERGPDLVQALKRANFVAGGHFDNPEPGDVMVVDLGGSTSFYVFGHDQPVIQRLVEFLQGTDFAGVIFSALPIEGTFPLSHIRLDSGTNAPDVVVSMRWNKRKNDWGTPGLIVAPGHHRGTGTHASLSPFDLHNTLIAAGPDFKSGFDSEIPSGNVDVAPTVLHLLGATPPNTIDGRVLTEAMTGSNLPQPPEPRRETLTASRDLGFREWKQSLTLSRVGEVVYHDEGNGESTLK